MARRYESRTTIFSPEGRLYQVLLLPRIHTRSLDYAGNNQTTLLPAPLNPQVEYAMEAISNAGATMGALATDGVVLVAEKKITSKVCGRASPSVLRAQKHLIAHSTCWCRSTAAPGLQSCGGTEREDVQA